MQKKEKFPLVVVLDNIRSMHNVGSIFRSADAFHVQELLLCGMTAQPPHRDIEKTALGATKTVDWQYFSDTKKALDYLKHKNYKIIAVEQTQNSILLQNFPIKLEEKTAFILGNEVQGVQKEILDQADFCVEIPQWGEKHSLNVSVCAGIVLWEWCRIRK